ncbi:hypothetical protein ANN_18072, partial [Periplaneta americana]
MHIIVNGISVMWISIAAVIINVVVMSTVCGTSGKHDFRYMTLKFMSNSSDNCQLHKIRAGIVFLIIMLSSCGGFFRYCYTGYRPQIIVHQITNYVPLPTDRNCPEERQGLV